MGVVPVFWEDSWPGTRPLSSQYPLLYNIVQHKNVTVAHVLSNAPLNIIFRRALTGDKRSSWLNLVERLMGVVREDVPDKFSWSLTHSGLFTVKSMYEDLMNGHTPFLRKYLWKLKVPLK